LSAISNNNATIGYAYDVAGRLTYRSNFVDGTTYGFSWAYDASGRLTARGFSDGETISGFTYDIAGRLKSIAGLVTNTTYNERSQPLLVTYANGTTAAYAYDANRGWLNSVTHAKVGATTALLKLTYVRDAKGRVTSVSNSGNTADSWAYQYDDLGQLTQATNAGNAALSQSYSYDTVGNMLSQTGIGAYTYPAASVARPHGRATIAGKAQTYDANGNMLTGQRQLVQIQSTL
jgi:YD repeat-containing protein